MFRIKAMQLERKLSLARVQRKDALDVLTGIHANPILESAMFRIKAMQLERKLSLARVQRKDALDVLTGIHANPLLESAMMHPRERTAEAESDVCSPSPGGRIGVVVAQRTGT